MRDSREGAMPGFGNRYYEVKEGFSLLRVDGYSWSNTYVGSSRAAAPVLLAVTGNPGDELHDLVGGLFYVSAETGETHKVCLVPPKHIFEKSYGGDPEKHRIDALVKGGFLTEVPEPRRSADYRGAVAKADKQYPDLSGGITVVDRDPLNDVADELLDLMRDDGVEIVASTIRFRSQNEYRNAVAVFGVDGVDGEFNLFIYDTMKVRLIAPKSLRETTNPIDGNLRSEESEVVAVRLAEYINSAIHDHGAPMP
jgi:hypothetical protein